MSYRRSSDDRPGSPRWRQRHRSKLIAMGLPDTVVDSDRTLNYVLLHGDDAYQSGWSATWLSETQAQQLLEFLTNAFADQTPYDIFRVLRQRLGLK
ncbi:MAG: hypothetical protein IPK82_44370 [Polyangiaceae bacterium]|nr:hypothetical protein [Polyangiaceae bacterium]